MNDINQLSKLFVKEQKYMIPRNPREGQEQIEVTFKAISLENPELLEKFSNMSKDTPVDKMLEAMKPIIAYSIGVQPDVVAKFELGIIFELFEIIADVNNFPKQQNKTADIQNFIKQKQELAKDLTKDIKAV